MCSVGCSQCKFLFGVEITEETVMSDLKLVLKKHTVDPFRAMDFAVEFGQICNCYLNEPTCHKIWPDPLLARGDNHHMWNKILSYSSKEFPRSTDWLVFYNSLDHINQLLLMHWIKKKMDEFR
jgi:hypothetical protein